MVGGHHPLHVPDTTNGDRALAVLRWLRGIEGGKRTRGLGNGAEVLRDELERLRLVELAGDEQHRVVWLIEGPVKALEAIDRHVLEVGSRADGRLAVVVPEIRRREYTLQQDIGRTVLAGLQLVSHDGHLAVEIRFGDERVHHPVGLQIERPAQVLVGGRERLEVVRPIEPGRAVRARAVFGQFLRDVAMAWRSLEHEMLEQVCHARLAVSLVARADLVGHVDRDGLLRLIGKEQDLEAVRQPVLGDAFDRGDSLDALRETLSRRLGGRRGLTGVHERRGKGSEDPRQEKRTGAACHRVLSL